MYLTSISIGIWYECHLKTIRRIYFDDYFSPAFFIFVFHFINVCVLKPSVDARCKRIFANSWKLGSRFKFSNANIFQFICFLVNQHDFNIYQLNKVCQKEKKKKQQKICYCCWIFSHALFIDCFKKFKRIARVYVIYIKSQILFIFPANPTTWLENAIQIHSNKWCASICVYRGKITKVKKKVFCSCKFCQVRNL